MCVCVCVYICACVCVYMCVCARNRFMQRPVHPSFGWANRNITGQLYKMKGQKIAADIVSYTHRLILWLHLTNVYKWVSHTR